MLREQRGLLFQIAWLGRSTSEEKSVELKLEYIRRSSNRIIDGN